MRRPLRMSLALAALGLAAVAHAQSRLPVMLDRFKAPPGRAQAGPLVAPGGAAQHAPAQAAGTIRLPASKQAHETQGGAGDGFGTSLTTLGDALNDGAADFAIGVPYFVNPGGGQGVVVLYDGNPGAPYTALSDLRGVQANESFGYSIAGVGDVNGDGWGDLLVGAPRHTSAGNVNSGRASLYLGSSFGYAQIPSWTFETLAAQAQVGFHVAWAGDVNRDGFDDWMVSAPYATDGETNEGIVYLFYGGSGGLSNVPVWTQESDRASVFFGYSCDAAGDVNGDGYGDLAIGAPGDKNPLSVFANEGAVYLFAGTAGVPSHTPAHIFYGQQAAAALGTSVAGVGDVDADGYADVLAGAPYYGDDQAEEGIANLYRGGPSFPLLRDPVVIQRAIAAAHFGTAVGSAGDVNGDGYADFMVGAPDVPQADGSGSAYLYLGTDAADFPNSYDQFDCEVASSVVGVSVGQLGDFDGDGRTEYAAGEPSFVSDGTFLYKKGRPIPYSFFLQFAAQGYVENSFFGQSAATIDMDGDGYDDFVGGSPQGANDGENRGYVAWYRGGAHPFPAAGSTPYLGATPDWTYIGPRPFANAGFDLANAGDVNADGYEDLVIGGISYSNGQSNEGYAALFYGSPSGPAGAPVWTVEGDEDFAYAGYAVSGGGDLDGDGYDDVAVGVPGAAAGGNGRGKVNIYKGSALGPAHLPVVVLPGTQDGESFGFECAIVGDIDRDGFDDLLVGAPFFEEGEAGEGRVLVYRGSSTGVHAPPSQVLQINSVGAQFGYQIARIGDVNGDGYADVAVGAPYLDDGEIDEGQVSVFYGSAAGLVTPSTFVLTGEQTEARIGGSGIGAGGDYDGDGYADLFVGMGAYDNGALTDAGRLVIYPGGAGGISGIPLLDLGGGTAYYYLGASSGGNADFNGDGASDLWFSAPGYTLLAAGEGAIGVGYGNLFGPNAINPDRPGAAWRTDGSAPVALGLRSNANNAFALHGKGRSAAGRTKLRIEYEAKPQASPFNFAGRGFGPWQSTASVVPGAGTTAALTANVSGLATGTRHHWRARYRSSSPLFPWSPWFGVERGTSTERMIVTAGAPGLVAVEPAAASGLALATVAPNPFVERAAIGFTLPRSGDASLVLYDVDGRRVRSLFAGHAAAGPASLAWDGRDDAGRSVPAGAYFARLSFAGEERVAKVVRLR